LLTFALLFDATGSVVSGISFRIVSASIS